MKRSLVAGSALALTLAGCARPEHPDWLIGTWAFQRPGVALGGDCNGGVDPRAYSRDGFYVEMDAAEYGRWELVGKRLIHHILRARGKPVPDPDKTSYIFRIDERYPDRIDVNRGPDPQMTMLRCSNDPGVLPQLRELARPTASPTPAPSGSPTPPATR